MFSLHTYPWDELTSLHREMDQLFNRFWTENRTSNASPHLSAFQPPAELFSTTDAWHVRVALPGIDPSNVHVDVTGSSLNISGERVPVNVASDLHVQEIPYGRFERTFTLPDTIDAEKVAASYRNGMLELMLPLRESVKPRRIEIGTDERHTLKSVA